ncbi:hypothetical protein ABZY81_18180 [Streptomyces sp. NPDC006514]|uniref:hypothetical protein n=1 Tax=Streptomyces sp. NPDC006514 TaxID=3154308 RepID=UPI0033A125E3
MGAKKDRKRAEKARKVVAKEDRKLLKAADVLEQDREVSRAVGDKETLAEVEVTLHGVHERRAALRERGVAVRGVEVDQAPISYVHDENRQNIHFRTGAGEPW